MNNKSIMNINRSILKGTILHIQYVYVLSLILAA